jgi:hypothetical protein
VPVFVKTKALLLFTGTVALSLVKEILIPSTAPSDFPSTPPVLAVAESAAPIVAATNEEPAAYVTLEVPAVVFQAA